MRVRLEIHDRHRLHHASSSANTPGRNTIMSAPKSTTIDYAGLGRRLESITPRPKPKANAPSVEDIRAALTRYAQIQEPPGQGEPLDSEDVPIGPQGDAPGPEFLDFADAWLEQNPDASPDDLIPMETDRVIGDQLQGGLDIGEYAREQLSNLPPEIREIIDRATHGDPMQFQDDGVYPLPQRSAQVEESDQAFEDDDIWGDIIRRVQESGQDVGCPQCHGDQPVVLGPLGDLLHVRCQHCGWDYALRIPPREGPTQEPEKPGLPLDLAKDNSNRFIHLAQLRNHMLPGNWREQVNRPPIDWRKLNLGKERGYCPECTDLIGRTLEKVRSGDAPEGTPDDFESIVHLLSRAEAFCGGRDCSHRRNLQDEGSSMADELAEELGGLDPETLAMVQDDLSTRLASSGFLGSSNPQLVATLREALGSGQLARPGLVRRAQLDVERAKEIQEAFGPGSSTYEALTPEELIEEDEIHEDDDRPQAPMGIEAIVERELNMMQHEIDNSGTWGEEGFDPEPDDQKQVYVDQVVGRIRDQLGLEAFKDERGRWHVRRPFDERKPSSFDMLAPGGPLSTGNQGRAQQLRDLRGSSNSRFTRLAAEVGGGANPMAPQFQPFQRNRAYGFYGHSQCPPNWKDQTPTTTLVDSITDPNWATSQQSQLNPRQMQQKLEDKMRQILSMQDGDPRQAQAWKEFQWLAGQYAKAHPGQLVAYDPNPNRWLAGWTTANSRFTRPTLRYASEDEADKCPKCDGSGKYVGGRFTEENPGMCYECKGTGKIQEKKTAAAESVRVTHEQIPNDVWHCPHCGETIGEKALYCDASNRWYHRTCMGEIVLPKGPDYELSDLMKSLTGVERAHQIQASNRFTRIAQVEDPRHPDTGETEDQIEALILDLFNRMPGGPRAHPEGVKELDEAIKRRRFMAKGRRGPRPRRMAETTRIAQSGGSRVIYQGPEGLVLQSPQGALEVFAPTDVQAPGTISIGGQTYAPVRTIDPKDAEELMADVDVQDMADRYDPSGMGGVGPGPSVAPAEMPGFDMIASSNPGSTRTAGIGQVGRGVANFFSNPWNAAGAGSLAGGAAFASGVAAADRDQQQQQRQQETNAWNYIDQQRQIGKLPDQSEVYFPGNSRLRVQAPRPTSMDPREFVQRNVIDPNKGKAPYALTRYDDRWYRYRVNPEEAIQGLHQQLSRIDQALRDPNTPPVTRQSLQALKIQLMGAGKVTRDQAGMGGGASTQDLTNYYSQYLDPSKSNMGRTQQASSHPRFTRLAGRSNDFHGLQPNPFEEMIQRDFEAAEERRKRKWKQNNLLALMLKQQFPAEGDGDDQFMQALREWATEPEQPRKGRQRPSDVLLHAGSHPRFVRIAAHLIGRGPNTMEGFISSQPTSYLQYTIQQIDDILEREDDTALSIARKKIEDILQARNAIDAPTPLDILNEQLETP